MKTPSHFAILAVGIWACSSSDNVQGDPSANDGSLGNPGFHADAADSRAEPSMLDASRGGSSGNPDSRADAADSRAEPSMLDAGRDSARSDASTLDAMRDSQRDPGPNGDADRGDDATFDCNGTGSASLRCAVGTEFCSIHWTSGELPMPWGTCEPLRALPCFATGAGCNCQNLPPQVDATACRCSTGDAGLELTLECH